MIQKRDFLHAMYLINHLLKLKRSHQSISHHTIKFIKFWKSQHWTGTTCQWEVSQSTYIRSPFAQAFVWSLQIDLRKSTLQNIFITYMSNFFFVWSPDIHRSSYYRIFLQCYSVKRKITCTDLWCSLHELFPIWHLGKKSELVILQNIHSLKQEKITTLFSSSWQCSNHTIYMYYIVPLSKVVTFLQVFIYP